MRIIFSLLFLLLACHNKDSDNSQINVNPHNRAEFDHTCLSQVQLKSGFQFRREYNIVYVLDADCGSCFRELFFVRDSIIDRINHRDTGLNIILNTRDTVITRYLLSQTNISFDSIIHLNLKSFLDMKGGSSNLTDCLPNSGFMVYIPSIEELISFESNKDLLEYILFIGTNSYD